MNQVRRKLEGDPQAAEAQKKAAEEAKGKAKEEASRAKSDLLAAQERIGQLEGSLVVEHGVAEIWQ